jgi:hypothetical protein
MTGLSLDAVEQAGRDPHSPGEPSWKCCLSLDFSSQNQTLPCVAYADVVDIRESLVVKLEHYGLNESKKWVSWLHFSNVKDPW